MTESAAPEFDLQAFFEWAMSCGSDVYRILQDLIERLGSACVDAAFRPSYVLPAPSLTLSVTEMHESLAKKLYIESIANALSEGASARLHELVAVEAGWDGGDAEPMSIESLATMETFFKKTGRFADDTGLFLGYDGEILINWTDSSGAMIDMAFLDGFAEIFTDSDEARYSIEDPELYSRLLNKHTIRA
jgi:hypothetical protein